MKKKVLVFKIGALGDILMSTPFLRELKKKNKDSQIDFLVGDNCKFILKDNLIIDNLISFEHNIFIKKNLFSFYLLSREIKKYNYDEIYILDKHWIFSFFAFLTRIPNRIGFLRDKISNLFLTKKIKYDNSKHEVDFYLDLINSKTKNKSLEYGNINEEDKVFVNSYLDKLNLKDFKIFVNLGGANGVECSEIRKIPENKFEEILKFISKNNKIFLIGSKEDKKYYDSFIFNTNILNLSGIFSIPQTIYLMEKSNYIFTTDCGPMHFGACTKTPMTCIFGPTNPKRKAPLRNNIKFIWQDEDKYEPEYELYGKLPRNKSYFNTLKVEDL